MGHLVGPLDLAESAHVLRVVACLLASLLRLLYSFGLRLDLLGRSLRVRGTTRSVLSRRVSHGYSLSSSRFCLHHRSMDRQRLAGVKRLAIQPTSTIGGAYEGSAHHASETDCLGFIGEFDELLRLHPTVHRMMAR